MFCTVYNCLWFRAETFGLKFDLRFKFLARQWKSIELQFESNWLCGQHFSFSCLFVVFGLVVGGCRLLVASCWLQALFTWFLQFECTLVYCLSICLRAIKALATPPYPSSAHHLATPQNFSFSPSPHPPSLQLRKRNRSFPGFFPRSIKRRSFYLATLPPCHLPLATLPPYHLAPSARLSLLKCVKCHTSCEATTKS